MRVNPEIYIVEGADGLAWVRRQHCAAKGLIRAGLPGAWARIETSGNRTEQERPSEDHMEVGGGLRGRTGAGSREAWLGVGLSHSSDEAGEGASRAGGAKGRAEQGSRRGER